MACRQALSFDRRKITTNEKVRALERCALRLTLTFDDDGTYLGQQLRVYAANVSGDPEVNDFQPRLVTGEAAEAVWARIDAASEGQEGPVAQGDGWRDYAYLPKYMYFLLTFGIFFKCIFE